METLTDLYFTALGHDKDDCLLHKVEGEYRAISSGELHERVRRVAAGLAALGVGRGDRVALMADSSPDWPTLDFATLCLGGALVPIYTTLTPKQVAYILRDSGSKVAVFQTREQLEGLLARRDELPELEHLVLLEGEPVSGGVGRDALFDAEPRGDAEAFEAEARKASADDLATLIYTSGTTGDPKGVVLTHRNLVSNVAASVELFDFDRDYTALSFLPLSHVFERMVDYCYYHQGVSIAYAESVQTVAEDMGLVRPHLFVSVPRVYEKVLGRIREGVAAAPKLRQKIFAWAERVARRARPHRLAHRRPPGLLGIQTAIADRLVFSKIKARLGGRFQFAISGGAPLGLDVAEFFWGAGIPIYEGYGLTETSPVIAVNTPEAVRLGTVGRPIPGIEVRIAGDGEILTRGPHVMKGYYNNPEATAETIDGDGWLHTGDVGELDDDGFLKITDRKKEILVNAYGKNVAPAPIENALKASHYIAQAVVIGNKRKFLSALLVPDFEALATWAKRQGVELPEDRSELAEVDEIRELLQGEIDRVNEDGAPHEQVRAWTLLEEELTVEDGSLTPTQKVKRRVVDERFDELIDRMYERAEAAHRQTPGKEG